MNHLELLVDLRRLVARVPSPFKSGDPYEGPAWRVLQAWAVIHEDWLESYLYPRAEQWNGRDHDKGSTLQFLDHCIQMEERAQQLEAISEPFGQVWDESRMSPAARRIIAGKD